MEWNRAKTILIISFFCLNILLAYQLLMNENNMAGSDFEMELTEETHQLLRNMGIRLEQVIPIERPALKEITVQFQSRHDEESIVRLDSPVANNILINKAQLEDVLAEQIPHAEEYVLDPILSQEDRFVLNQLHEGLPMFDVTLNLYIENNFIHAYSQNFVNVDEAEDDNKDQRILSAYAAIGFLAENYLQVGSVIQDISLGYHGQVFNAELQVFAPKWRVALEGGEIYFVNGINGAVETP